MIRESIGPEAAMAETYDRALLLQQRLVGLFPEEAEHGDSALLYVNGQPDEILRVVLFHGTEGRDYSFSRIEMAGGGYREPSTMELHVFNGRLRADGSFMLIDRDVDRADPTYGTLVEAAHALLDNSTDRPYSKTEWILFKIGFGIGRLLGRS